MVGEPLWNRMRGVCPHRLLLSVRSSCTDKRGVLTLKDVGSTHALRRGPEDDKTLAELHFQAGDYMDVALIGVV